MSFTEMAMRMYPYWIMGLFMFFAVFTSKYRYLLRVEYKPVLKWLAFLIGLTAYRIIIFKYFTDLDKLHGQTGGALDIPLGATATVFWEDLCHTVPVAVLAAYLGQDKLWKKAIIFICLAVMMISFGLGHTYQGYITAFILSFYIPYTFRKGREIGFGSIGICHMCYDFVTILTLKHYLG